jgi:urea transport system substrate-binding protein
MEISILTTKHKRIMIVILYLFIVSTSYLKAQGDERDQSPIKIGVLHSSTGTMAISERSLVDAINQAIGEINNDGGVLGRKIVPIIEDGASDPSIFAKKAEKLIKIDKVSSIFGCWTSASRKEVLPIIEKYNNLLWYPVQYEGYESSPNIIYTGAAPNQQIIPAVEWSLKHLGKKFFLVGSDYIFPREANRIIKKYLKNHGGILVGEEYRQLSDQNFKEIAKMIIREKPDVIINSVNGDSNISLFLELNNISQSNGYKPSVMSLSIAEDELMSIGTKLTIGNYCAWNYFQSIKTLQNQSFVESFKELYGNSRVTDDPIVNAYFQVYLFAKAVTKSKSTEPSSIRNACKGLLINAPCGEVMIDSENQHTWKYARIGKIGNYGQFEIVWSSDGLIKPDPYLKEVFTDTNESLTNIEAFKYIYDAKSKNDISVLINALNSNSVLERQEASLCLSQLGVVAKSSISKLGIHLSDSDLLVCQNSLDALGSMGIYAFQEMPSIINALKNPISGVRFRAAVVIDNMTHKLQEDRRIDAIPVLVSALNVMVEENINEEYINTLKQSINYLKYIQRVDWVSQLYKILSNSFWFWIFCLFLSTYFILATIGVRIFPLWILKVNMAIQPDSKKEIKFFNLTMPLQYILIVGFFQSNQRILDAWIKKNIGIARENFLNIDTVKYRKDYIPVPVTLNEIKVDNFDLHLINETTLRTRWCFLIHGQGGTGKTALACQMGIWAMEELPEKRLCSDHQMIPVLIEPNSGADPIRTVEILKNTVLGQLSALVRSDVKIPEFLLEQLLRKRRILIIIDDLTGLSDSSWNLPGEYDFPFLSLIVTSRVYGTLGNANPDIICPLHVHGERLSSFIDAYLTKKGCREEFSDDEFFDACKRLTSMVGASVIDEKRALTVLFAKMYADQLIGNKLYDNTLILPKDIPNLMLGYINELNRINKDTEFSNQLIHQYTREIAWECIKVSFRPRVAKRETILKLLNNNNKLLDYFEKRLGIIQAIGIDYSGVKFTIDPLAEYLAGLYVINKYKADDSRWSELLKSIKEKSKNEDIKGFILALRDCCLTKGQDEGIPSFVLKRIDDILEISNERKDIIKVGILHSLTGNMAISERSLVDAITLAINEINYKGGVLGRKLGSIIEDGGSDRQTFKIKAKKLILDDEVCSIFGCWTSADRKIILPIIEKYNHLLWYPLQYEGFESSPNIIYTGAAPNQQIIPALKWCLENIGEKCFLIGSDYEFPRVANKIVKAYLAKEYSTTPLGEDYIELGDKNFKNIISKIQNLKPDFIFNTVNGDSNMGLFSELNRAGITADEIPVMSVSIAEDEVLSIGPTKAIGHYCAWNYFQSIEYQSNKIFVEAFKDAYGERRVTDDPIEAAYSQVHLFAKALTKAGNTEPQAIREAARGLNFAAPGGEIVIDEENQHTWKVSRIAKISHDGQFDIVWSSNDPIRPDPYLMTLFPNGLEI